MVIMHTRGHALWPAVRLAGLCGFDCQGTILLVPVSHPGSRLYLLVWRRLACT